MKTCTKCGVRKYLNSYTIDNTKKDKLRPICRECTIKAQQQRNKKYPWIVTYNSIKQRCNNPNNKRYKDYGGRGIKCLITVEELKKLWFRDKAYDMKSPTIDKINNNRNYELCNCQYLEHYINTGKDEYKAINQYDLQGGFIKSWKGAAEVERILGFANQNISKVCTGKRKRANGFIWRFKDE